MTLQKLIPNDLWSADVPTLHISKLRIAGNQGELTDLWLEFQLEQEPKASSSIAAAFFTPDKAISVAKRHADLQPLDTRWIGSLADVLYDLFWNQDGILSENVYNRFLELEQPKGSAPQSILKPG